ncbi:S-layer homology domain-containing protein [Metabacillus fastidiosus]|uniref:S-layer homology domain-containing protein n=1 Tax=Metabacillus fastidiosus TaxID=1458 RepID=UPI002E1A92A4|nr:S-layer homology domain-containing protein [Metabacillus fastidiosus]
MKAIAHYLINRRNFLISMLLICFLFVAPEANAKPLDFNGGVQNEYLYEEVFFLTGTPIKFTGKMKMSEKENKDKVTTTYQFTLTNGTNNSNKLNRSISFETTLSKREDKGQTTSETKIKSYSEKVTINKTTYSLDDYQFSQSSVIDNRPASDYYSGNVVGRKIYKVNKDELITVHVNGRNVGYKNFWGATETQLIDYEIISNRGRAYITSRVSDSKSKTLHYEPHDPVLSSFTGGHIETIRSGIIGEYTYDIPYGSGKGTIELSKENVPSIKRLIVPKFRDLAKHPAKSEIERLYSLGIFDESSKFFSPNTTMTRYDFMVGVLKAINLRVLEEPQKNKQVVPKKSIYKDMNVKDPNYLLIENAVKKGVITGATNGYFKPKDPITRVQAAAILVSALGMEDRAPNPGYQLSFVDKKDIPNWAKDSVYVAEGIGLMTDRNNYFKPNEKMTRAQASQLLIVFLNFLENDLKKNYRDDVLFY